jgi:aminoglycoside 3-N-acetyltransferase
MGLSERLYAILPEKYFNRLRKIYRFTQKKIRKPLTLEALKRVFNDMQIQQGDVVFVHASFEKLHAQFTVNELLETLLAQVGEHGTLLFPSWSYSGKTADFIRQNKPFNVKKSFTAMGMLAELARRRKNAIRSNHPTTSIAAIGRLAEELTATHELSTYPCDEHSPYFKMMNHHAKIIGIGEKTMSLSFVHCPEDTHPELFREHLHLSKPLEVNFINRNGEPQTLRTFVRNEDAPRANIVGYIQTYVPDTICKDFSFKGRNFFVAQSKPLYDTMIELAIKNTTIYTF